MKRVRFTCLVIFFASLFSLKNVNCDSELSKKQGNKPKLKVAVILSLSEPNSNDLTCSDKFFPDALQNVEAVYYALDQIEKDDTLSRNFTLTVEVTENSGQLVSEMKYLSNLFGQLKMRPVYAENATVGLIYTNDLTVLNYEYIFKSFHNFPRISYSGPLTGIEDIREIEDRSPTESIMLTSGHIFIVDVMFKILKQFNWKYVAAFSNYCGPPNMPNFTFRRALKLAERYNVCIVGSSLCSGSGYNISTEEQIEQENMYKTVDVIICYCEEEDLQILKSFLQKGRKKYIVIAGSVDQYWTKTKMNWTSDLGDLYYVTPTPQYHEKFYNYYTALSMNSSTKHTYLKKFRERYFEAKFDSKMKDIETSANVHRDLYKNDSRATVNIIKSLYTMVHALDKVDPDNPYYRMFAAFKIDEVKFEFLNEELSFRNYKGLLDREKFDIHKFKTTGDHSSGDFIKIGEYLKVGFWSDEDQMQIKGKINIDDTHFKYSTNYPKQTCSKQCSAGHFRKPRINRCCWECVACNDSKVSNGETTSCKKCALDTVPDQNKSACIPITEILPLPTNWNDSQNLISIGMSSFSIILTMIVIWVFVKYQNTPAIKSTTRELCYVMFAGIILVNASLFISAVNLNFRTADTKILLAVGFTMIYAALLVKTNRIARILVTSKHKFANMNPKYVSLKTQILITSILIGIEVVICWFAVKFHDPDPDMRGSDLVLRRFYLDGVFFIKIFAFVALLILFCTYYAFKTRNLPENFNETKCIGFAMYTTVLTAVAFSMVYFATDSSNKILAMNLCASINTLTILIFLFSPKLYIILWKPERNTRAYFSPVKSGIRSYIGNASRSKSRKPQNQCYSLETSLSQSSSHDAVENSKEYDRNVIEKTIKEIAIQLKELNLDASKEEIKTDDLQLYEMIDDLQKAYEKIEKIKLKHKVGVNRV